MDFFVSLKLLLVTAACVLLSTLQGTAQARLLSPSLKIAFSPANPISTEPFAITFTDDLPDGREYVVTVFDGYPPHRQAGLCQAIQKAGIATCRLSRIAPGFYTASTQGGDRFIQAFNFSVAAPGASTVSALHGHYNFRITSASASSYAADITGSFTADGRGRIPDGTVAFRKNRHGLHNLATTGSYILGADGQGTIALNTARGHLSFAIMVPTGQTLSIVTSAALTALPGSLVQRGGALTGEGDGSRGAHPAGPQAAIPHDGSLKAVKLDLSDPHKDRSMNRAGALSGTYAFLFEAEIKQATGATKGAVAIGTFTADGSGRIVSGIMDANAASGMELQAAAVTGTYRLDAAGKGSLRLQTPQGSLSFGISVPPVGLGMVVDSAGLVSLGRCAGRGEISRSQAFFNHGIAFHESGSAASTPLAASVEFIEEATPAGGFQPGAGLLIFHENLKVKGASQPIAGAPDFLAGAEGSYADQSMPGSSAGSGRSTMTLSNPGEGSETPKHYALYQGSTGASGSERLKPVLYFLSLDPHPAAALVAGKMQY